MAIHTTSMPSSIARVVSSSNPLTATAGSFYSLFRSGTPAVATPRPVKEAKRLRVMFKYTKTTQDITDISVIAQLYPGEITGTAYREQSRNSSFAYSNVVHKPKLSSASESVMVEIDVEGAKHAQVQVKFTSDADVTINEVYLCYIYG